MALVIDATGKIVADKEDPTVAVNTTTGVKTTFADEQDVLTNGSKTSEPVVQNGGFFDTVKDTVTGLWDKVTGGGGAPETVLQTEAGGSGDLTKVISNNNKVYGTDTEDYFAQTAEVTQQANAQLLQDQLSAEQQGLKTLDKTSAAAAEANEAIYGAEYSDNQMTDKFGWTGGQLMDSKTRMQTLRDHMSADILANEQHIDNQYANDITKAKAAMMVNKMSIAEQAAKTAYSNSLAMAEMTGYYIDPVAGDLLGRFNTFKANNPDGTIDPTLETQLIDMGFYKTVDGTKILNTDAIEAMSGIMTTLDRNMWETGIKQALLESGYTVDEVDDIIGTTEDLLANGEEVETDEEDITTTEEDHVAAGHFQDPNGDWIEDMTPEEFGVEYGFKQESDGSWTAKTDAERVADGKYKTSGGEWVDWWTDQEGIKQQANTGYEGLYAEWANDNQARNEYDAAMEYFRGANLADSSAELMTAMKNGSNLAITATSDNKAGKGLYNDEYKITYTVNGETKSLLTRGNSLLIASAVYKTDFGDMELLWDIYNSQGRGDMSGNEYDGGNRIFGNYWFGSEANSAGIAIWDTLRANGIDSPSQVPSGYSPTQYALELIKNKKEF